MKQYFILISLKSLRSVINILFFITVIFTYASCNEDEDIIIEDTIDRTVIIYMAADNNLSDDALDNINQIKKSISNPKFNVIIFVDGVFETPSILKIEKNRSIIVKNYPEFNSADAKELNKVLLDIISMYPSKNYGLVLWSHGISWLPSGASLRSFGNDNHRQMNISDLASFLPIKFDYILFDACLMGSVEVAYELKDKADYIIASSTEILSSGFPYPEVINELSQLSPNMNKIAQNYFDYYNALQGAYRSATISVIETQHLPELAYQFKILLEENTVDLTTFNRTSVQRLDVYEEQYTFDLADFINKAFPDADKTAFLAQLNKTVWYKNNTSQFIQLYDINTYCGLSCYIPIFKRTDLNEYYKQLSWYKAGGYDKLFRKF
ncbi:Clostripain [termite gut metagenome]|uniref:Clostripain n=1 Tax=termite gut metagenome TaxID=433724 RepID=A0A5J4SRQ5_9ZZZZ